MSTQWMVDGAKEYGDGCTCRINTDGGYGDEGTTDIAIYGCGAT
jgi:hypothetical protein